MKEFQVIYRFQEKYVDYGCKTIFNSVTITSADLKRTRALREQRQNPFQELVN